MNDRSPMGLRLLNDYQRDFPLVAQPYADIAAHLGLDEATVMDAYREGLTNGTISRIGAVVAPRRLGASTLAAMAVPEDRLEAVAAIVNAHCDVNHNYEREDHWNLWFVVTANNEDRRAAVLKDIETKTRLPVLSMPLREEYHIDLGFNLQGDDRPKVAQAENSRAPCALPAIEQALLTALQEGLSLSSRPYALLGEKAGLSEAMTLEMLSGWLADGLLKRFGVIVRHRALGYTANAMCVWNVPDDEVTELGRKLAAVPGVTLCYQRERALPQWPYNLYCMIHGKAREDVLALRQREAAKLGLDRFPHQILFSNRCFKQCGARYASGNTHHE
ncbi:MAG TPA: Lrp/AsnC family transcriptional regulator [Rhodocyclaceae bacterium]